MAYKDPNQNNGPVKKKHRSFSLSSTLTYILFVLGVSFVLSTVAILVSNDMFGLVQDDTPVTVTLEKGESLWQVASTLKEAGLIDYKWAFRLYAALKQVDSFSTGEFDIASNMDYGQIISELRRTNTSTETVTITIPEGYTINQIAELMEKGRVCGESEFIDTANKYDFSHDFLVDIPKAENRLEGYLFPDTYDFFVNERPVSIINKMLNNFDNKYTDEMMKLMKEHGYTISEVVNIASLIEKEAKLASEQATISGVIHNRLNNPDKYPYLDIDASLLYVIGHKETITSEDLETDSPYNLRKSKGLPPTAICNPGIGALLAAISPQSHSYYYYVAKGDGSHIFSKTLEEHNAAVASVAKK
ncbi:MAG: endolytic transglycosylase MltG [Clostridiaceae bacterium]|nr:endolytic transglycosylase MltG [Clostridiaceae bacterium]